MRENAEGWWGRKACPSGNNRKCADITRGKDKSEDEIRVISHLKEFNIKGGKAVLRDHTGQT